MTMSRTVSAEKSFCALRWKSTVSAQRGPAFLHSYKLIGYEPMNIFLFFHGGLLRFKSISICGKRNGNSSRYRFPPHRVNDGRSRHCYLRANPRIGRPPPFICVDLFMGYRRYRGSTPPHTADTILHFPPHAVRAIFCTSAVSDTSPSTASFHDIQSTKRTSDTYSVHFFHEPGNVSLGGNKKADMVIRDNQIDSFDW